MSFAEKLSRLRRQSGLTQSELAERLGLSLRTITNYETGGRSPKNKRTYQKIADIFHVDVNYLLSDSNETFLVYANERYGSRGIQQAQRLLAEVRGLFAGGDLAEEDKDEMMRTIQEAYWIAKDINQKRNISALNFNPNGNDTPNMDI